MPLPTITLNGRAVDDLELRFTPGGKAVANVRVAASESKKNDQGGYDDGERFFANVSLWEGAAEAAAEAGILKGDPVLVTGSLYERKYETRDGGKGSSMEIKYATVAKIPPRQKSQGGQSTPPQPGGWGGQPAANDPWGGVGATSNEAPF